MGIAVAILNIIEIAVNIGATVIGVGANLANTGSSILEHFVH
jgi:hypothetical protein